MAAESDTPRKFLTFKELVRRGIFNNRMTLKRAMDKHGFPRPYRPGDRRVLWAEAQVDAWLAGRRT
jgi:predicted DNA-binding transcriptional regulator AlpA